MRLIDADEFREQAIGAALKNGTCGAAEKANALVRLIDAQPTAYDVDKVAEQLEKCAAIMTSRVSNDCFKEGSCQYEDCMVCVFKKAVEIIKGR